MANWRGQWDPTQALPDAFLELPQQIYQHDAAWLPEDSAAVQKQFSLDNTWFDGGEAFVGVIAGKARLAGFFRQQTIAGETAAFFGFWETVADPAASEELFAALADWARSKGATSLYGPINFSTFGANRLRLDGFADGCFPGEPWNPDYYPAQLEALGGALYYRYLSTADAIGPIVEAVKQEYLPLKPALEKIVRFEAMTGDFWMSHLDELYPFIDQVFGGNFAYTPLSRPSFEAQCGEPFARRLCPQTSVLARTHDGRIAGFFLVFPDYSPLLRQGNPQRIAASEIDYARCFAALPSPRVGLAKTGGVHPDFRSLRLFTAMSCELSLRAEGVYDTLVASLVRDDNPSKQFALRHGNSFAHHYGLYRLPL